MELLKSRPLMTRDEVLDYVTGKPSLILVVSDGMKPLLFSNGRPVPEHCQLPDAMENVSIYALDKLEALDFLYGDLELPRENRREVRPEGASLDAPKTVRLKINLDVPPEFALPIENGVVRAVRHLSRKKIVVVSSIEGKGRVRQGFTGTNLLVLRIIVEGYSLDEIEPEIIANSLREHIERELGFKTTISISELRLRKVEKLPLVKFQRGGVNFRGGRVLEVPLSSTKAPVKVDLDKLQREVERILQEAGLPEELLEVAKKEENGEAVNIVEKTLIHKLSNLSGVTLNWVKVTCTDDNYSLAVGINRTSRSLSDVQIIEAVREAIRDAESEARAAGSPGKFVGAYVVIEKDIY